MSVDGAAHLRSRHDLHFDLCRARPSRSSARTCSTIIHQNVLSACRLRDNASDVSQCGSRVLTECSS
jgi:hypothetical protein